MTAAGRLLSSVVLVVAIATAPLHPAALGAALAVAALALALTRPAAARLGRRALVATGVVLALLLPLLWVGERERALALGARAVAAVLTALTISSTLDGGELGPALRALWVPASLTAVIDTLFRQLGSVREQGRRLLLARRLRGARGIGVGPDVLAALLVKTARRAERVGLAMRLRGYDPRQAARRAALRRGDLPGLLASALAAIVIHLAPRWA